MCKECNHDPYLAGHLVFFMLRVSKLIPVAGSGPGKVKMVHVEEEIGPYVGRCVSHHRKWVTLRTKKNEYRFREDDDLLLAYEP